MNNNKQDNRDLAEYLIRMEFEQRKTQKNDKSCENGHSKNVGLNKKNK